MNHKSRRKNLVRVFDHDESTVSGEATKARSTSVSLSGARNKYNSRNHKTQTFDSSRNTNLPSRERGRGVSVNSQIVRSYERRKTSREPEKNGAKTASNKARNVKRKRISRGVQVELKDVEKSSSWRGCFVFKCCVAKNEKAVDKGNGKNSEEKQHGSESSDAYQPKVVKREKKPKIRTSEKEGRISGGAEQFALKKFNCSRVARVNDPQRHSRQTWRSEEPVEDRWVQKNEASNVKRRLNDCLIELNRIIGDASHVLRENIENS